MKERTSRSLLRSVALLGAMTAGASAFGDFIWSGGASASWSAEGAWTGESGNYVINDKTQDITVTFGGEDQTVIESGLWIENGSDHTVTFVRADPDALDEGLAIGAGLHIGTGYGNGNLKLSSGVYASNADVFFSNGGAGALTIENATLTCQGTDMTARWVLLGDVTTAGAFDSTITLASGGVLEAWHIQRYTTGGTCQIVFDGGTLKALGGGQLVGDNWADQKRYPTIVVGENGGTIDTAGFTITIDAPVTGAGTLNVIGDGKATFSFVPDSTVTITAAEGTTIDVAKDETYTWTGAGGDNLWSNTANWSVSGSVPETAPAADSVVVIPEGEGELTISCAGATDFTGTLTINRNVTFTGAGIAVGTVDGTGKLTVDAGEGNTFNFTGNGTIKTELGVANGLYCGTAKITVEGALTGAGSISFDNKSNAVPGLVFKGDTSGFSGTYSASSRDSGDRDGTTFDGSALGSENAAWRFGNDDSSRQAYTPFKHVDGLEYKFGSLVTVGKDYKWATDGGQGYGRLSMHYRASSSDRYIKNTTFKVGALEGSTSNIGGTLFNGTTASATDPNKIVKVGNSTAYIRLTSNDGVVEVQKGTVYIAAASDTAAYAPVSCTISGTDTTVTVEDAVGTWQKVVDIEAVEDNPETEEDETVAEVSHQELVAKFVPVLSAELLAKGYQLNAAAGESSTTYTIPVIAKDASDVEYYSVSDAIAALAEAEDKTVTLIANTTEAVALPLGYTLVMNGFTAGSVAGVPGVAVEFNEETGTYTTVSNAEATWVGSNGGSWDDPNNWDTKRLPDAGTAVKFTSNATVTISDYSSDNGSSKHKCASITLANNVTVTFQPPNLDQVNYWPRIDLYGDVKGGNSKSVLKLYRCGLRNRKGSSVAFDVQLRFENDGTHDSWLESGDFTFKYEVSGTGKLRVLGGKAHFSGGAYSGFNIPEGTVIDCDKTPTYGHADEYLTGSGRIILRNLSDLSTRFNNALKNGEKWTGTCELAGVAINNIDAANYGSMSSTVCFNGTSGFLRASTGATTEVGKVKTIEIGANGLTLNNGYSSGAFGYIIAADITGSGPIHFGTRHNDASVGQYFLTGSLEGFTGAIDFGALGSYRPAVIIKDADAEAPAVNDYGQIIVAEGSEVTVAATWAAPGGFVVYGDVTVASTGSITGINGLCGDGTVTYAALPTTAPGCCAGITSSGTNRDVPAWTGTVVLPGRSGSGQVPLAGFGREGSTIVVNGDITGQDANSIYLDGQTIGAKVELNGLLKLTNGSGGANYTFAEVTGAGDIFLSATGSPGSPTYTYTFTKLNDYTGTINAVKTSDTKYAALAIGTVNVSEFVVGKPVVKLAANANLTTDPAAITFTVDGEATDFDLMKADDGNIYVIVAEVTVPGDEPTTKQFGSYEAAAAFAEANNVASFAVLAGDGQLDGWDYDSEAGTLTANENTVKVDDLGAEFATIAAARAAEGFLEGSVITLIRDSDEDVTVAEDATLNLDVNGKSYAGAIGGAGTFVAVQDFTPAFAEGWTGTFVIGWAIDGGANGTAFPAAKYGNENSTVRFDAGASNIFFSNAATNGPECLTKLYLASDVSIKNGWGTESKSTTFSEVTIEDGVTFTLRDLTSAGGSQTYFTITKLATEGGKIVVPAWNTLTISEIVTDTDSPYLALEKNANGTLSGLASVTVNGEAKTLCYRTVNEVSGLYDPVAKFGDNTYDTLAGAIDAAKGSTENVVELLSDTDEGYTFASGDKVAIKWNGKKTGEIAITGDDAFNAGGWNEETGTTTYDIRTAVAYVTVGDTVTPKTDPMAAMNDFLASPTGATLRFVGTNPFAETEVPCTTYNAETMTYTKLPAVAQVGEGLTAVPYPTLADACAAAEADSLTTVTLLVARDSIEEENPEDWEYNTPEASGTDFGTLTKKVTPPSGGLDPANPDSSFASDATTEESAVAAAKASIVAPAGADENYAECFTYAVSGEAGAYVVTIAGIADAVTEDADASALEVLTSDGTAITIPAGLWYNVTTCTVLGGEGTSTGATLSTGSVSVTKPGTTQGFIEIKIGAKESDVQ